MKKLFCLLVLVVAVIITGCKDDVIPPEILAGGKFALTVHIPEAIATKSGDSRITTPDENLHLKWEENDQLIVAAYSFADYMGMQELTLTSGANTNEGNFEGELVEGATRYVLYYKAPHLTFSESGQAVMDYRGQQQHGRASTAHLRDYLLLASDNLSSADLVGGTASLTLLNGIMRFDVASMKADIGKVSRVEWVNAYQTHDARSLRLDLDEQAANDSTLTAYFSFSPDSMQVALGDSTGVLLYGTNAYAVLEKPAGGKTYAKGACLQTTVQVKPAENALTQWQRIQMDDEIWVKTSAGSTATEPTLTLEGFKPEPVSDTDYWCYKHTDGSAVTAIPDHFFNGGEALTVIRLPKTVQRIGAKAFADCTALRGFYYVPLISESISMDMLEGVATKDADLVIGQRLTPQLFGSRWMNYPWKTIRVVDDNGCDLDQRPVRDEIWVRTADDAVPPTLDGLTLSASKDPYVGYWKYKAPSDIQQLDADFFARVEGKTVLTEILLPEGLEHIGAGAFRGCSNLTVLELPEELLTIGDNAFAGCDKLNFITIPGKVTSFGKETFTNPMDTLMVYALPGLEVGKLCFGEERARKTDLVLHRAWDTAEVDRPSRIRWMGYTWRTITYIGGGGPTYPMEPDPDEFWVKTLGATVIPRTRAEGDDFVPNAKPRNFNGFDEAFMIEDVDFWCFNTSDKENIVTLLRNFFQGRTELVDIFLPKGVRFIDLGVFSDCTELENLNIPETVESIGDEAFKNCVKLPFVKLPESLTKIGEGTFKNCEELTEANIPSKVKEIAKNTFENCKKMNKIIISEGVTSIGDNAFTGCEKLPDVKIPETTTNIGKNAFDGCKEMTEIIIPEGVTTIGSNAFEGCTKLEKVEIPSTVTEIGDGAFKDCGELKDVTIKAEDPNLGKDLFEGVPTEQVEIKAPEKVLENESIKDQNWGEVKEVEPGPEAKPVPKPTPEPSIPQAPNSNEIWVKISGEEPLTELNESFGKPYKVYRREYWSYAASDGKPITSIASSLFENATDITEIWLPSKVNEVGSKAFKHIPTLTAVTLPKTLKTVGTNAFDGCTGLTTVELPDSVVTLGANAFNQCTGMQKIVVKAPHTDGITAESFGGLTTSNVVLLLNKDWSTNGSQHPDPASKTWLGLTWKAIGDALTGNVEIEDLEDSENGFQ